MTEWRLLPALLAIVGLVAAACGDDSSSDSAEEPAPTTAAAAVDSADDTAALEQAQADAAAAKAAEADAAAAKAAEADAAAAKAAEADAAAAKAAEADAAAAKAAEADAAAAKAAEADAAAAKAAEADAAAAKAAEADAAAAKAAEADAAAAKAAEADAAAAKAAEADAAAAKAAEADAAAAKAAEADAAAAKAAEADAAAAKAAEADAAAAKAAEADAAAAKAAEADAAAAKAAEADAAAAKAAEADAAAAKAAEADAAAAKAAEADAAAAKAAEADAAAAKAAEADAAAAKAAEADAAAAKAAEADAAAAKAAEAEEALAEAIAAAESAEGVDPEVVADLEKQLQEAQEAAAAVDDRNCVDEVVIGTVWPMSGTFSFVGSAEIAGATKAVEDINAAGGIESLCGATLRLAVYDAGGSAGDAATAVERLLDDEPDVSAIAGSWLSSFSLAATEVSERAGIPFITESFADSVTDREGFSHVFGYAPPASAIKGLILDAIQPGLDQAGITMETVAVVGSTSAAAVPLQEALLAEFSERGIEVAVTDTWAPGGLDDPSGVATKIANADVDVIFNIAFAFSDVSGLQNELIARGVTAPVVQNGGQGLLPAWADLGSEVAGLSTFVYANPLAGSDAFNELATAIDQPYARQDHIGGYFVMHLIAAAIEQSGDPSPAAVTKAFNTIKLTEGVAVDLMPTSAISFSATGRIDQHFGVLAQWQEVDGSLIPCTVYPLEFAICQPVWD